ncbi:SAM-dependent methyltransferase [Luteimonas abyssi]|uniref:SAM-dependent methyltransferase n=1 Tax=Luteimonas abyssi TaxID=1247514 RepID=UPI000737AE4F|nr:SAM-dependent methyltransferase [Luteimonas abyssi]
MSVQSAHFEMLHAQPDPWGVTRRWYEQRKRALLMASLPQARFSRCWEAGCSVGALTAALAERCEAVVATDAAAAAVERASQRLSAFGHVRVERQALPDVWPDGTFDLIVVSELAYYLDAGALDRFVDGLPGMLREGGTLVACHWRWPFDDRRLETDRIHAAFARIGLPSLLSYRDADIALDAWGPGRSVAQAEGLVPVPAEASA